MWFNPQDFLNPPSQRARIENTYYSFFRTGVLLDSEILYLLIVGRYDAEKSTNFLSKINFDSTDYEKLRRFLTALSSKNSNFYITPHVFTKFIHLLWENIKEKDHYYNLTESFLSNFSYIDEKHIPKNEILKMEHFKTKYCDLCNASLILTAELHKHNSIITSDKKFAGICEEKGDMLVVYYPDIKSYIQSLPHE